MPNDGINMFGFKIHNSYGSLEIMNCCREECFEFFMNKRTSQLWVISENFVVVKEENRQWWL